MKTFGRGAESSKVPSAILLGKHPPLCGKSGLQCRNIKTRWVASLSHFNNGRSQRKRSRIFVASSRRKVLSWILEVTGLNKSWESTRGGVAKKENPLFGPLIMFMWVPGPAHVSFKQRSPKRIHTWGFVNNEKSNLGHG